MGYTDEQAWKGLQTKSTARKTLLTSRIVRVTTDPPLALSLFQVGTEI